MSSSSPPPTLPPTLATPLRQAIDKANTADARIQALLLSTLEGVPLGRVAHTDHASYEALETIWAPPSKQYGLLGKVKKVTAFYDHAVVLHVYQGPLVLTLICSSPHANIGAVYTMALPRIQEILQPLEQTLGQSLSSHDLQ